MIVMRVDITCVIKVNFVEFKCKMATVFSPNFSAKQTQGSSCFGEVIFYLQRYADAVAGAAFLSCAWRFLRDAGQRDLAARRLEHAGMLGQHVLDDVPPVLDQSRLPRG